MQLKIVKIGMNKANKKKIDDKYLLFIEIIFYILNKKNAAQSRN